MAGVHPSTFQSSVYSTKLAIKIVRSLVFGQYYAGLRCRGLLIHGSLLYRERTNPRQNLLSNVTIPLLASLNYALKSNAHASCLVRPGSEMKAVINVSLHDMYELPA